MSASSVVVCFRKLISACPSEAASSNGPLKSKPSTSSVTPRSRDRCTIHLTVGGVPEHQVSHCGILERNYEIIIYGTRN